MRLSRDQLLDIVDAYREVLAGGDILSTLRLHAARAGVNLNHVNLLGLERLVVYNVLQAANAQDKIEAFLAATEADGFSIGLSTNALRRSTLGSQFPRLQITRYASYLPSSVLVDDSRFRLLEGRILNPLQVAQRVFLEASVSAAADVVKTTLDVPPDGAEIPHMRMPRFTRQEARQLSQTIVPAALNVELYVPGVQAPVDSFQHDVWVSQSDIVLIVREGDNRTFEDYTPTLAWWVNSGAEGLTDFLAQALPLDVPRKMGYPLDERDSADTSIQEYVDDQVRVLCEGIQKLSLTFMPTELIWTAGATEIIQRVRRPEEVLSNHPRRANCLEGAILFTSLIECMGLDPILIIVPRHALAGWKRRRVLINPSDPTQVWQVCGFLDTTLLSSDHIFETAVSAAQGYFLEYQHMFGRKSGSLAEFARIIDVKAARGLPPSGVVEHFE